MLGGKNKQRQPFGYTIVEVMIVLAVSGMMFVIAANFINGKQARAAFTQGSNDVASMMQGVVSDITDGHYSDIPIHCSVPSVGAALNFSGTGTQGQNSDCVFLGKIIHFYSPGAPTGPKTNYQVFSLAGARSIASFPSAQVSAIPGLTTQSEIPQNLEVRRMDVVDTSGAVKTNVYNIGFAQGIGVVDPATGVYASGAQQAVSLIYGDMMTLSEGSLVGAVIKPARSATICLSDGSRYARVVVGGANNSNQLSVNVQQLGTVSCV